MNRGLVVATLLLFTGCAAEATPGPGREPAPAQARGPAPTLAAVYGDEATVATVRRTAAVKVVRLRIADGPTVTADAEHAARLAAALTDPTCVRPDAGPEDHPLCSVEPLVLVRLEDPLAAPVEVLLCFSCERLAASRGGASLGRSAPFAAARVLDAVRRVLGPIDPTLEVLSVFAEERNRRLYREATALEVHRISSDDGLLLRGVGYARPARDGANPPAETLRFGARVDVSGEVARRLGAALLEPANLRGPVDKGCAFKPGVLVRAWDGPDAVDVVLCFECDDLVVYRGGEPVGASDFAPGRAALVAAVKAALPADREVQSLR